MVSMSRRVWLMISLASLACAAPLGAPAPYQASLTPPWSDFDLPLQEATVVFSNDAMLTVHHPKQSVSTLTERYTEALEKAGHIRGMDTSGDDMTSIAFGAGETTLALGILSSETHSIVSLTRYTK
jgi:hypothetical protein